MKTKEINIKIVHLGNLKRIYEHEGVKVEPKLLMCPLILNHYLERYPKSKGKSYNQHCTHFDIIEIEILPSWEMKTFHYFQLYECENGDLLLNFFMD